MYRLRQWLKHRYQKLTRGFSDDETWNLDMSLADWIIPRLRRFKELATGYPADITSFEQWQAIIDEIIWTFEYIQKESSWSDRHWKRNSKRMEAGLALFAEYLTGLWW